MRIYKFVSRKISKKVLKIHMTLLKEKRFSKGGGVVAHMPISFSREIQFQINFFPMKFI